METWERDKTDDDEYKACAIEGSRESDIDLTLTLRRSGIG